jgi:hypothetical protein
VFGSVGSSTPVITRCRYAAYSDATTMSAQSLSIAFWIGMPGSMSDVPPPSICGSLQTGTTGTSPSGLRPPGSPGRVFHWTCWPCVTFSADRYFTICRGRYSVAYA